MTTHWKVFITTSNTFIDGAIWNIHSGKKKKERNIKKHTPNQKLQMFQRTFDKSDVLIWKTEVNMKSTSLPQDSQNAMPIDLNIILKFFCNNLRVYQYEILWTFIYV